MKNTKQRQNPPYPPLKKVEPNPRVNPPLKKVIAEQEPNPQVNPPYPPLEKVIADQEQEQEPNGKLKRGEDLSSKHYFAV